jgi:hypothetical protein
MEGLPGTESVFAAQDGVVATPGGTASNSVSLAKFEGYHIVTVANAADGVVLPPAKKGMRRILFNDGANAAQVFAGGGSTIDGVAGATGVPLTNAKRAIFYCFSDGAWLSAQLGVVSA